MKIATAHLKSVSPYEQSKFINIKKETKETHEDFEKRIWRERMHIDSSGRVLIPPMAFKNCLCEAARYLKLSIPGEGKATYTKHFVAGVLVIAPLILPIKAESVPETWLHLNSDGKRGGGTRVLKCMPVIQSWEGDVTFHILDEKITEPIFRQVLSEAGNFIGIGTFRPINGGYFGRFTVEEIQFSDRPQRPGTDLHVKSRHVTAHPVAAHPVS